MDEVVKNSKIGETVVSAQTERKVEDRPNLEQQTLEIRAFCQKVESMMQAGLLDEVRKEMAEEIPKLIPIQGEKEPVKRMFALFSGVAGVVKKASGHDFDTVINPCSGSDISAGLSFGCSHLVTVDNGELLAIYDKTDETLRTRIKENLRKKLVTGMHQNDSNQGLVAYAMELALNEVDLNSLEMVEEEKVGYGTITSMRFVKEGKFVIHTNFSRVNLRSEFDASRPEDAFLESKIRSIIENCGQLVLLSKAGAGVSTTSFFPLLPEHAVVVSDINQDISLKSSGALIRLQNLKTDEIQQALDELQGEAPLYMISIDGRTDKQIFYGYATDLRNLEILEVRK